MTQERADMQDGLVAPADVLDVLPVIDIEAQIVVNEAVVRGFLSAQMGPQMNLASMRSTISDEVEGNRGLSITGLVPNAGNIFCIFSLHNLSTNITMNHNIRHIYSVGQNNVNEVKTLEAIERTPLPQKITTKKILKRLCRPRRRV